MKNAIQDHFRVKSLLRLACVLFASILLTISASANAQKKKILGTVVGENHEGIPGVNVVIKGTTIGTVTDVDGKYEISANNGDILAYSFIGYLPQEVIVSDKTNYNIVLKEEVTALSEVVVVGYGVQKKSDLTGAISTIKPEELVRRDVSSIDKALQGQIAGVNVTQGSGTPGEAPVVRIRGIGTLNNADPLYVVDGMMVDNIDFLNARDIESLQVLKDASASAIYGSRGANGVIIITTKRGKAGEGKINVNAYYGVQGFAHIPEVTTAAEWGKLNNEAQLAAGQTPKYTDPASLGKGTDWVSAISNKNAPIENYDLSFSGGNDKSNYFISGSYLKQKGIIKKSDYDRISVRVNSDHQVKKWLKFGENITISSSNRGTILEGDEWNNLLITPLTIEPVTPVYNKDGSYGASQNQQKNPVAAINNTSNKESAFKLVGNTYGEVTLLKGLTLKTNIGIQHSTGETNNYYPIYIVSPVDKNEINKMQKSHTKDFSAEWTNTLNYAKVFNEIHNFSATLGTSYFHQKSEWDGLTVSSFPNDDEENRVIDNSKTVNQAQVYGSFIENNQISYLGRVNYSYANKYLFTANFRADGSSKFGSKHKWGYFPSFSAGWKINEEKFMQNSNFISTLKLRAGWGQIGNQGSIPAYTQSTIATSGQNYVWNNKIVTGVAFNSVGNDEIKWETTTTTNVGLDFGFWKEKFTGEIEYYYKKTTDMLLQVPVPGQTGIVQAPWQNAGAMQNKGFELALQYKNKIGELSYSLGGNFSTVKNEVISLGGGNEFINGAAFRSSGYVTRTVVGKSIANFYGLVAEGLFQNQNEINEYYKKASGGVPANIKPGDVKYRDVDGDGNPDYDFIGSPIPDFTYSINGNLSYKGFDFSFLLNGVYGNDVYYGPGYYLLNSMGTFNLGKEMLNRWTGEGSTNNPRWARMNVKDSNNTRISSRYVEDGSFLRLQNIQIGYTLPQSITNKLSFDKIRFYVSGQNLYTFTKYSGYDPEVGGTGLDQGLDRATYPVARTITIGLNLGF